MIIDERIAVTLGQILTWEKAALWGMGNCYMYAYICTYVKIQQAI